MLSAKGKFYGADLPTNNGAECQALVDLMEIIWEAREKLQGHEILVYGDSRLVIDFANRKARPGLANLFLNVRRV